MEDYQITGTSLYYEEYKDDNIWDIDDEGIINIPGKKIIMQGDTASRYIPFRIKRYRDGIDLSEKKFQIIYNTSDGRADSPACINTYMNDEYIRTAWLIDPNVTQSACILSFQVFATGMNENEDPYNYHSQIKTLEVLPSLDKDIVISEKPQLYTDLMNYVHGVLDGSTGTIYAKLSRNLAVMEARISEIAATAGTNTADTEIGDARVRLNGTAATCLGDEIRAKADGYIYEDGKFYLTSGGIVITEGIEFKTDLSNYLTKDEVLALFQDGSLLADVVENDTGFTVVRSDGTEFDVITKGGQSFNGGYHDDNGYIHLTKDGEDIPDFTPFIVKGGGGGSDTGSKLKLSMYTASTFSVLDTEGTALIKGNFSSTDAETGVETGAGTLTITVGGVIRENRSVPQGDFEVDVFKYLNMGTNEIVLVMTDSYGLSATRKYTVVKETFGIGWSLGETLKNTGTLQFYITPTGSGDKTIYTMVDGEEYSSQVISSSGRRLTISIPNLMHGAHQIEVYGEMTVNGVVLTSNHLRCAVAQVSAAAVTPIVAVNWPEDEITQFSTINIPYMVVNPMSNPTEISYLVNGVVQSTETVDQSAKSWSYKPVTAGEIQLGIMCDTKLESKTYNVAPLGSDVEEVIDGLDIKIDPSIMTNLENWTYGAYSIELSEGFDNVNGGLQVDENGVHCIRITAGDRMTLNYPMFSGDARKTGKEFKIIYKVKDSSNRNAEAIKCEVGGIGLNIMANKVVVSGDQTSVTLPTCEDEKTELDINIQQDSEDRLLYLWERCSTFSYAQYAANENFTHQTETSVTFGSDDADVILYLFRAYNRDLTTEELKANFIFDGADGNEIQNRKDRNDIYDTTGKLDISAVAQKNPYAHVIIIDGERMSLGKQDYLYGVLRHTCVSGGAYHSFSAKLKYVVQGTSSVEHADTAGPNLNFVFTEGITLEDGTVIPEGYAMYGTEKSVPTCQLTFKKNIASEDHIVNAAVSEWYNRHQPVVREARVNDPRVRDCMESCMAIVFFHNTGTSAVRVGPDMVEPDETVFFGLGNLCSNKDSNETFMYDDIVIEVKNNTSDQVRFKSDDLTGDNFSNNYEFRYLNKEKYTEEQAQAEWQKVQSFAYSCDYTAATNMALPAVATFNGQAFSVDSAAYRKAKWKAEAPNYFDMKTIYHHADEVLLFLLRDNCGKNMFWSLGPDGKWRLIFAWDHDTGARRNNEGYIDIERPYLIFDTEGTADVYNASDNVIWTNIFECNWDELKESYFELESAGGTDMDAFYALCKERQSYICEALWIEDVEHNAIRTMQNLGTTAYLGRGTGKLDLHLKHALIEQKTLVDSYFCSTAATKNSASFRGYTPDTWAGVEPNGLLGVTPYCDMFINILAGSTPYRERAYAGETVWIDISANLNDTEIYLRQAEWIEALSDMSGMYLGQFEASKMKRIKVLKIGSDVAGYVNTNFTTASFDNCVKLEELNLGGLINATKAFDFSPNLYLKKVYSKGSGVTGYVFAKNGRLQEARINAVASLILKGLKFLETFEMEDYTKLTSLTIEDCPIVDTYALTKLAVNLAQVRLLDIDWSVPVAAYDVLMRLDRIHGIDDDGYSTDEGVLTGNVYFNSISETKYNTLVEEIPEITFTYGEKLEEFTASFCVEGVEENAQKVEKGGAAVDPYLAGYIKKPTKAPTIENLFEFYGWDTRFDYIVGDITINATFTEIPREYTVKFADKDGRIDREFVVPAHGSVYHSGEGMSQAGYVFIGWDRTDAELSDVTQDMVVNAVYEYPTLPPTVLDLSNFDYVYSDDPEDNAAYTFGNLYAICKTGQVEKYIPATSRIKMALHTTVVTDSYIVLELGTTGYFELSDGTGVTNADWIAVGLLNVNRRMNPTNTNVGGYGATELAQWLENDFYGCLDPKWKQFFVKRKVYYNEGNQSANILSIDCHVSIPSFAMMGGYLDAVPYKNEVYAGAKLVTWPQFTDNNSRIGKHFNGEGSADTTWVLSAWAGGSVAFGHINTYGTFGNLNASHSYGVRVCLSS